MPFWKKDITPVNRFDPRILFPAEAGGFWNIVVQIAQVLFVVSVLYLIISSAVVAKKLGCRHGIHTSTNYIFIIRDINLLFSY